MSISPYDGESPDNLDENREKLIKAVISTLEPFQIEELAKEFLDTIYKTNDARFDQDWYDHKDLL